MSTAEAITRLDEFSDLAVSVGALYERRAAAIRDAHDAGVSISEIARRLNVGRKVVYDAIEVKAA